MRDLWEAKTVRHDERLRFAKAGLLAVVHEEV